MGAQLQQPIKTITGARERGAPAFRKQLADHRALDQPLYVIKCHGGLGDIIWIYKVLQNLPYPLFLAISTENKHRPRRSGFLADHLPRVIGWRYDDTTFAPGGQDWPSPDDPACMIDKTWYEQDIPLNVTTRVECNRWLESGRRLEGWLPDLSTTHHFEFEPCGPPTIEMKSPAVVMHLAGWPDVPDEVWVTAIDLFRPVAHVYIVGGSYDHRPRLLFQKVAKEGNVSLLEDVPWTDLIGVLKACSYVFGHASGFTAIADVLKVPGAVINPRSVPRLVGTWNSLEHTDQVHIDRVDEFQGAMFAAYRAMADGDRATWPPTNRRGVRLKATTEDRLAAVRAAAMFGPRRAAVWAETEHDVGIGAAILDGSYRYGRPVDSLYLVGCSAATLSAALRESQRSTRRPAIEVGQLPWPGRRRGDAFDLIVLLPPPDKTVAARMVREAWATLGSSGTLLIGGALEAYVGVESLAAGLKIQPIAVQNASGWWYLHRRI